MRRRAAVLTRLVGLLVMVTLLTGVLAAPVLANDEVPPGQRVCKTFALDAHAKLKVGSNLYIKDGWGNVVGIATVVQVGLDVKLKVCLKADVAAHISIGGIVVKSDGSLVIVVKVLTKVDGNVIVIANLKAKVGGLLTVLAQVKAKVKVKANVWLNLYICVDP
ncbi:MAG: hypothetical protein ACRDJ4_15580 [Actinomycetota bacterium]